MPTKFRDPPLESLDALREEAKHLPPAYAQLAKLLWAVLEDPLAHFPHPVYVVGLEELASPTGLASPRLAVWRYMVSIDETTHYAIEVGVNSDGTQHSFAELQTGPFVDETLAIFVQPSFRDLGEGSMNVEALRINALATFSLWLRASLGTNDIITAVPPTRSFLTPWPATYTMNQFEGIVKPRAVRQISIDSLSP